jgi:uncharacterized membrane protein
MASPISVDRIRVLVNRLRERLWVKPLVVCLLSIGAVFAAKYLDTEPVSGAPAIAPESVESLLSIMAASMLVIATFSVGSMVSAYASASTTATPRAFTLLVADGTSQNALSTFVGAFIYSVVGLIAVKNGFFERTGVLLLFILTVLVFAIVIVTFVRWVDNIARLGRMGTTIDTVEEAAVKALRRRRDAPTLRGVPVRPGLQGSAVFPSDVGYVQHVHVARIQSWAEAAGATVEVAALPGTFATKDRPLAYVRSGSGKQVLDTDDVVEAFEIGDSRVFDDDPRFGLVVLSEIAGRALSPGINDPGTAIDIIGTLVRLFTRWSEPPEPDDDAPTYDRVEVPELSVRDMFDDAFTAIARDGAGTVEVALRLQKALRALGSLGDAEMAAAAEHHAQQALARAEKAMDLPADVSSVRQARESKVADG